MLPRMLPASTASSGPELLGLGLTGPDIMGWMGAPSTGEPPKLQNCHWAAPRGSKSLERGLQCLRGLTNKRLVSTL